MSAENFYAAIDAAKKLETKAIEYTAYSGDVEIREDIDLSPEDFVDLTFDDMVNEYERAQKILSTRKLNIYSDVPKETHTTKESMEVESKIKEMTTETLESAEQVKKEEIVFEKPAEEKIEFERPQEAPVQKMPEPEILEERVELPVQKEEKPMEKVLPPVLAPKAEEAEHKFDEVEEQINRMLGGKTDEITLKKKMLELTKQLFKEKSHNKRAEIKLQITAIKNMIVNSKSSKRDGGAMLKTLVGTQQAEVTTQKDKIIDTYNKKIVEIKNSFYEEIGSIEDIEEKKKTYEKFVMSVTSLIEKLPEVIAEYQEYSTNKHLKEVEKWKATTKDRKALAEAITRMDAIKAEYPKEFGKIKKILAKEIETLVEITGNDLFNKPEQVTTIVKEINETDEGTLLYYLHSNDLEYYRKYERKHLSKAEAINRAKQLLAEEKGLDGTTIDRYFKEE